jgi:fluoroacetyl-CoA thioesterase
MTDSRDLIPGLEGKAQLTVSEQHLASAVGSGLVQVFSTPMMIALMEHAAANAVHPLLEESQTSVGVRLDVRHLAATPLGMHVRAYAKLIKVEGRILTFEVWAEDEHERVGEGIHERAVIDRARFEARVREKAGRMG